MVRSSCCSTLINSTVVQVLNKCDDRDRENWLLPSKKVKTKIIYLDDAGNDKLLHLLLLSLACWLMLERRSCVYNTGLKVDKSRDIDCGYDVILRKHLLV